jgi:hypothetical protein
MFDEGYCWTMMGTQGLMFEGGDWGLLLVSSFRLINFNSQISTPQESGVFPHDWYPATGGVHFCSDFLTRIYRQPIIYGILVGLQYKNQTETSIYPKVFA